MKSQIKSNIEYTLILDEQEARWLRDAVQNPLRDEESPLDQQIRGSIWDALEIKGTDLGYVVDDIPY